MTIAEGEATACFLSGRPGVGKTSLIKAVLAQVDAAAGGFYTEEVREQGRRLGFRIVTLDGQVATLAHVAIEGQPRVSRYGVNVKALDDVGVVALERALAQSQVIIIDEVGKMELFSPRFLRAVWAALDSGKPVLGTIMLGPHPEADRLKADPRLRLIELTEANRGQVAAEVLRWLGKRLAGIGAGEGTPEPISVSLDTKRGVIRCLFHRSSRGEGAVILVGGTDGGFDGPADAIYPTLAEDLLPLGISSLRLDFRLRVAPGIVAEGVHDVLQGIAFLKGEGMRRIGLVGHSYGGAVVIAAAARSPEVAAVVTLSTQTAGAQPVAEVAPRPILFVHGEEDRRLPPELSRFLYQRAAEPKELVILPGAKHSLRQRREELRGLLRDWFRDKLR